MRKHVVNFLSRDCKPSLHVSRRRDLSTTFLPVLDNFKNEKMATVAEYFPGSVRERSSHTTPLRILPAIAFSKHTKPEIVARRNTQSSPRYWICDLSASKVLSSATGTTTRVVCTSAVTLGQCLRISQLDCTYVGMGRRQALQINTALLKVAGGAETFFYDKTHSNRVLASW